jgi:hypothetical protein
MNVTRDEYTVECRRETAPDYVRRWVVIETATFSIVARCDDEDAADFIANALNYYVDKCQFVAPMARNRGDAL